MKREQQPRTAPTSTETNKSAESTNLSGFPSQMDYIGDQPARTNYPVQASGGDVLQLARSETRGKITYDTEDFTYGNEKAKRERVSKVIVTGKDKVNKYPPNEPISFMNMDTGKWDDMDGWHKGHVAARRFGGSHASWNIVPMLPNFNIGPWSAQEDLIEPELLAGETVTITPLYHGSGDPRIPNKMKFASSKIQKTIDHKVPTRKPFTDEDAAAINKEVLDEVSKDHALKVLEDAKKKGFVPDNFANSPYLPLDIFWLNGGGPGAPGSRVAFHSWQVDWLIRYNKRINDGKMKSDAWGPGSNEPHRELLEGGRKDRPEVDHIVPKSRGGANFFCNARLVSWELNNKIERVVDAGKKYLKW